MQKCKSKVKRDLRGRSEGQTLDKCKSQNVKCESASQRSKRTSEAGLKGKPWINAKTKM